VPLVFDNEGAQVSVTKDFQEDFHRFMATLTESIYESKGQTLLYLPPLEYEENTKKQAQNKDLTQRLEQVIIRWTCQMKEV
jgi:dynein heavy chain